MVDKVHIDALVRAAVDCTASGASYWYERGGDAGGSRTYVTRENMDAIGQMLVDTNVYSVSYRYGDTALTDLPGRNDAWWILPYRAPARYPKLSVVAALKAIDGYEYQACEHPEWEASEAHAFCQGLRREMIHQLPGYDEADWAISFTP